MNSANPVLIQAQADLRPDLVDLDPLMAVRLEISDSTQAMGAILEGTPMAGRPLLFCATLISMNVLNYQFWDLDAQGTFLRYRHEGLTGALAMQQAFLRIWQGYVPEGGDDVQAIACAVQGFRDELEVRGLQGVFGEIPAAQSRLDLLDEVLDARALTETARTLVDALAANQALSWKDAKVLAGVFPLCYEDAYLKKAQLTLMFIAAQARAMGWTVTLDVTAAADYQLPKVLRALGVLTYSDELAQCVDSGQLLEADSAQERAIRAATVLACDVLARYYNVSIEVIDFWLWQQRTVAGADAFHLTRTTNY